MAEGTRISKRTQKLNLRSTAEGSVNLKDVKHNLKSKKKGEGIISSVPKEGLLNETVKPTGELVVKSTKPSNEATAKKPVFNKGQICSRKDLRPNQWKGTTFEIDCLEMAESALEQYNMNTADLELFLRQNMRINKNNKVRIEREEWKLVVTSKIVINDKKNFNKTYLKLLLKKFLWKRAIRDWVYVDARQPTTLKMLYYRTKS